MATINFKREDAPASKGFELIPAGRYAAQITASEMKTTKAGTGEYLQLTIQLLDEPYTGRLVWERLNLVNPNEVAVQIAQRTLADILAACNVEEVEDSEELHGIEFEIDLVIEPPKGDFPESNKIKKYHLS